MRNLSHARGIDGINMSRGCPAVSDDSNVEFFQNIPVIERGDRWHNVCRRKSRMAEPRIIVFVKAPRPGFVKTRLGIVIGDEAACMAYRQLTETVLEKLASLPNVEIRFTPDDAKGEIKGWLRKGWVAKPQDNGDLGQRMHRSFKEADGAAIILSAPIAHIWRQAILRLPPIHCKHTTLSWAPPPMVAFGSSALRPPTLQFLREVIGARILH